MRSFKLGAAAGCYFGLRLRAVATITTRRQQQQQQLRTSPLRSERASFRLQSDASTHCCACRSSTREVAPEDDSCIEHRKLIVVGGGAAGVYGALRAKKLCPQLEVVVLEKGRLLSKVRISGGGRCNLTTGLFDDALLLAEQYPRGNKELRGSYFRTHGPQDTAAWFTHRGVSLKTEDDGRMFPTSNSSATIIDCLLNEASRIGVILQTKVQVSRIFRDDEHFHVQTKSAQSGGEIVMKTNYVLLATGSAFQGYDLAAQLGHSIIEPRPSLFTFKVTDPELTELSGVSFESVKAELDLPNQSQHDPNLIQDGPLLITHWGLSGPVVLRLSAWAARHLFFAGYKGILWVDFAPKVAVDDLKSLLVKHKQKSQKRMLGSFVPEELPIMKRFWIYLLQRQLAVQELDKELQWAHLPTKSLHSLALFIKRCPFPISGKGAFKDEFVTAGGIPLVEVDLRTMESRQCRGLFLAGEVLNVDGITGGFNFQNAWTGGYISGTSIANHANRYLNNRSTLSSPALG